MTPDAQQELRRRCVIYFRDGVKRAEIARRLGLSRQWVTLVIEVYQTEGFESAVAGKKRGMNEAAAQDRRLLTREEEQKVAGWIIDKNPAQMNLVDCQGRAEVDLSGAQEGSFHVDGMTYLRSWGMTPQRPKKKAIQQNDAAVKQWLGTDYP